MVVLVSRLRLWARPAVSGGAFSGDGAGRAATAAAALADRGRREGGAGDRASGAAWGAGRRPDQVKAVGRGASNAGVQPPRGRRRVERGGRRAREREGRGSGPRCPAGPKGRRVGPAAPVLFFLKFFSQFLSKFIWTI